MVSELNGNSTLSNDRFTKSKYDMLYVKPKVRLSKAGDNKYSLKLGCDCVVSYVYQAVVERIKKRGENKQVGQNMDHQDLIFGKGL